MYKYYNAHPKGFLLDDCINRAISVTAKMEYFAVCEALGRQKKASGAEELYGGDNPRGYIENVLGAEKISFKRRKGLWRVNGARFCKMYPRGRYILDMGGHWSAVVDGILLDTWDPSDEYVLAAYRVTPTSETRKINLRLCYTVQEISDEEVNVTFYDANGRFTPKTLSREDAEVYIESLEKRGYPDMTDADKWL